MRKVIVCSRVKWNIRGVDCTEARPPAYASRRPCAYPAKLAFLALFAGGLLLFLGGFAGHVASFP